MRKSINNFKKQTILDKIAFIKNTYEFIIHFIEMSKIQVESSLYVKNLRAIFERTHFTKQKRIIDNIEEQEDKVKKKFTFEPLTPIAN